ncbi:MAG TPA: HEAT repeat domain-containing protein, partial [Herpetosiphonaceae bacterium]|nr:HEAT repeat domain-containing protein [Herpetosiphonaceae bacterium]
TTEVSKLATLYVALGNAAAPSSLPVFEAGLAHSDPRVRFEALVGLRDLPADQTIKLIDSALSDPDPAVAETAGEMLKTLTGTTPQPSANTNEGPGPAWNWNDNFGGGNIYANIHVNLSATKPYGHLKLNGQADIDVHLLNKVHKNDVVKVQATTYVIASNTRRFGFYLFVMGDKFKYYEKDVKCADTPLSGTVWKGSRALFTYDWGWKIKGIGFGLTLSFGASMEIKYALSYQACDTNATIAATLNPGIWIWTKGDAGLNIGLFKAGVVAEVEFLRTWLPVTLSAKAGASGLKIGYNVSLQFKPIAVYISAYWAWLKCVNFWKWQWEWQYQNKGLWSWEHKGWTLPLINGEFGY